MLFVKNKQSIEQEPIAGNHRNGLPCNIELQLRSVARLFRYYQKRRELGLIAAPDNFTFIYPKRKQPDAARVAMELGSCMVEIGLLAGQQYIWLTKQALQSRDGKTLQKIHNYFEANDILVLEGITDYEEEMITAITEEIEKRKGERLTIMIERNADVTEGVSDELRSFLNNYPKLMQNCHHVLQLPPSTPEGLLELIANGARELGYTIPRHIESLLYRYYDEHIEMDNNDVVKMSENLLDKTIRCASMRVMEIQEEHWKINMFKELIIDDFKIATLI